MPDISKTRNHNIEADELRRRLDDLAGEMKKKFGISHRWEGDVCHLSGSALKSGILTMSPTSVSIELTLGMMARMLKGQIEREVDSRMEKILSA
jgi:putative polyhydroxyalkanoate system protein